MLRNKRTLRIPRQRNQEPLVDLACRLAAPAIGRTSGADGSIVDATIVDAAVRICLDHGMTPDFPRPENLAISAVSERRKAYSVEAITRAYSLPSTLREAVSDLLRYAAPTLRNTQTGRDLLRTVTTALDSGRGISAREHYQPPLKEWRYSTVNSLPLPTPATRSARDLADAAEANQSQPSNLTTPPVPLAEPAAIPARWNEHYTPPLVDWRFASS